MDTIHPFLVKYSIYILPPYPHGITFFFGYGDE